VLHFKESLSQRLRGPGSTRGKWFLSVRQGAGCILLQDQRETSRARSRLSLCRGAITITGRKSPAFALRAAPGKRGAGGSRPSSS